MRNKLLKFIICLAVSSTINMCTLKKEHARAVKNHKHWQDSVNAIRSQQLPATTPANQSYQEWKRDQDRDSAWKKVMSK